jgi:hypothetical protein
MASKGYFLSGAALGWSLYFGLTAVAAPALDHERRDYAKEPISFASSDLQHDEQQLAADRSSLRRSLLKNATIEQIARLRKQVRQDWFRVVLDRGYPHRDQEDRSPELAARRHGGRGRRG